MRERDRETIATEESIIALEKTTVDCNEVDRFVGEKGKVSIIFLLFFLTICCAFEECVLLLFCSIIVVVVVVGVAVSRAAIIIVAQGSQAVSV